MNKVNYVNTIGKIGRMYYQGILNTTILINALKPFYYLLNDKKVKYKFTIYKLVYLLNKNKLTYNDILELKLFIPLFE